MKSKLFGLLLIFAPFSLSSCGLIIAETTKPANTIPSKNFIKKVIPETVITVKSEINENSPTVAVTRYKIDQQCNGLVPTDLEVAATKSMEKTVETIIGDRSNGDFRIAGYRLNLDPVTKVAILDLRLPLDAPRTINSLSHCEQFALFGELRETLTKNSAWKINTVQFQSQGEAIQF